MRVLVVLDVLVAVEGGVVSAEELLHRIDAAPGIGHGGGDGG